VGDNETRVRLIGYVLQGGVEMADLVDQDTDPGDDVYELFNAVHGTLSIEADNCDSALALAIEAGVGAVAHVASAAGDWVRDRFGADAAAELREALRMSSE